MKKIKILSIALIILAMCIALGVTSWAAGTSGDVEFTATSANELCVSNEQREVTVTIAASKEIEIFSFDATIIVPEGWSIKSVTNETLGLAEGTNYKDGHIIWYQLDNVATTELATITYTVPANAKGDFTLGLTELQLGKLVSPSYEEITNDATVTTTLTIKSHEYEATGYEWEGNTKCIAYGDCKNCTATTQIDSTSYTSQVTTPATCEKKGKTTYTVTYAMDWAETQTKEVEDVPMLPHEYTGDYQSTDDGHAQLCVKGCNQPNPTITEHDFTNGDCACGAEKPAPAGLKGDVNLDSEVDMKDVVALMQHILQDNIIEDLVALSNGEVTGDATHDMNDVVKLMQYVLKDIDTLD